VPGAYLVAQSGHLIKGSSHMSLRGLLRGSNPQKSYPQISSAIYWPVEHKGLFSFNGLFHLVTELFHEVHSASASSEPSNVVAKKRWKLFSSERGKSRTWNKMEQLLHTPKPACLALGISRSTLYRLIAEGEIEVTRVRSLPRFTESSLKKFIERQVIQTREQAVGF
jgi:excisionase family DNA binding protein